MDKREKNNSILDMLKDYVDEQRQLSFGVELGGTPAVVGSIAREYDFVLEIIESFEETESDLIDQLDEPDITETSALLENVLKENKRLGQLCQEKQEEIYKLLDSQSSESEKPVIPDFVAEWIDRYQKHEDIYTALSDGFEGMESAEVYSWLHGYEGVGNQELFARAWLDGYTVTKEKTYRVLDKEGCVLIRRYGETVRRVTSKVEPNEYPESNRGVLALTEQEIKDYDERFWPFAVPVKELEE